MVEFVIIFAVGYFLGYKMSSIMHLLSFKKVLEELGVRREDMLKLAQKNGLEIQEPQAKAQEDPTVIEVKLEQHQGQIYAFRKDTDQFLGQGPTAEALIERLNQTMQPCRLIIDRADGADLLQKNNNQNG